MAPFSFSPSSFDDEESFCADAYKSSDSSTTQGGQDKVGIVDLHTSCVCVCVCERAARAGVGDCVCVSISGAR